MCGVRNSTLSSRKTVFSFALFFDDVKSEAHGQPKADMNSIESVVQASLTQCSALILRFSTSSASGVFVWVAFVEIIKSKRKIFFLFFLVNYG